MESIYSFDIFTGPQKTFSVFQDTRFLSEVLAQRARAADNLGQELEKIGQNIDNYIVNVKTKSGNCPDTLYFLTALEVARSDIHNQQNTAEEDARKYGDLAVSLTRNQDEKHLQKNLRIEEMAFHSLRGSFERNMKDLNEAKMTYRKTMIDKDIVEIKQLLSNNKSRLNKLEDRDQKLKERLEKVEVEYTTALITANETCQHLDSASTAYLKAWQPIVEKRARKITETLAKSIPSVTSAKCYINKISYKRLLSSLKMTETITPPRFQEVTSTNEQVALLTGAAKSHCKQKAIAIEVYKTDTPNQLNFKSGERITLLLPANIHGLAYGERKSKFGKKKRGFFPASLVQLLD